MYEQMHFPRRARIAIWVTLWNSVTVIVCTMLWTLSFLMEGREREGGRKESGGGGKRRRMGEWDNLQHHLFSPARASTEPQGRMNRGYLFSFMISEVSASKSNSILYKRLFGWARACLKRSLELRFTVHADSSSRTDGDDGGRGGLRTKCVPPFSGRRISLLSPLCFSRSQTFTP